MAEEKSIRTKPIVVFDGDCGFCRMYIIRWQAYTLDRVDYAPYQEVHDQFPEIPVEAFRKAVQFIEPDGTVSSGARAALRALSYNPNKRWMYWLYLHFPGFAPVANFFYQLIASHRPLAARVTRLLYGNSMAPSTYHSSQWFFLQSLAAIYFIAFVSLWTQVPGLIGSEGILSVQRFLEFVGQNYGQERYWLLPSLCWFSSSDVFLQLLCGAGVCLSLLLLFGIAPGPVLFLLWATYLSLVTVSRDFLSFQWDVLLLETGFLAILLVPPLARNTRRSKPNHVIRWLLKWLLFRLLFSSGMVKLLSDDPTWQNLTALNYHYWTQPLPTWIGWYANLLPEWFQKFSVAGMFAIELAVPFLIFTPRRMRILAFWLIVTLQILIFSTGNYAFFNLLTVALSLFLLDDAAWSRGSAQKYAAAHSEPSRKIARLYTLPMALLLFLLSCLQLSNTLRFDLDWPRPLVKLYQWSEPFRTVNGYGLFAHMTTHRDEIIIEGSNDGKTWLAYEFKYKPGGVKRRPQFVEPLQPRLDWQMWFAALQRFDSNDWFLSFCYRILEGSSPVIGLLEKNPFPDKPPRFLRATIYEYRFTDWKKHRLDGSWWERTETGLYCPALALRQGPNGPELYSPR